MDVQAMVGSGKPRRKPVVWRTLYACSGAVDAVLRFFASVPLDVREKRINRLAMNVPEYREIEERDSKGYTSLQDVEVQFEIRSLIAKPVWWEPGARWLCRNQLTNLVTNVRMASQRVFRGWDDRSLWSLDDHLTKTLSEQLNELANIAHGYPAGPTYTFEQWQEALRVNAAKLARWSEREEHSYTSPEYAAINREVKEAFAWVAENLGSLWD
jgi:hypothetical protein